MISVLYRYPKTLRRNVASVWGKRSAATQAKRRVERGSDAETLYRRTLHDARGQLLRHGCTYSVAGEKHWRIVRSIQGRTDQRDVIVNGQLFKTCGPRRLPTWLR
jgi:hypothetical protein